MHVFHLLNYWENTDDVFNNLKTQNAMFLKNNPKTEIHSNYKYIYMYFFSLNPILINVHGVSFMYI